MPRNAMEAAASAAAVSPATSDPGRLASTCIALQEIVRAPANGVQGVPQLPCATQRIPKLHHVPCQQRHAEGHRQVELYIVSGVIISSSQIYLHTTRSNPPSSHSGTVICSAEVLHGAGTEQDLAREWLEI